VVDVILEPWHYHGLL